MGELERRAPGGEAANGERHGPDGGRRRGPGPGGRLLLAVLAGLALLAAGVVALDRLVLPGNGRADTSKIYDYVYAAGKSENVDFVLNNMSDDGYLVFGTSELYISKNLVSMCPQAVFGENVTGVNMTFVGEAYDQSLWQAIAAGAYGSRVKNKKVMLIVSPQWFFKGNGAQNTFSSKFSYSLYRAFMQNSNISDDTKAYVRRRCAALGVDAGKLAASARDTPLDAVNDVVYAAIDGWQLRAKLGNIVSLAPSKSPARTAGAPTGEPDWDALLAAATAEGEAACTNNDYGIYDDYYTRNGQYLTEAGQNFTEADEEYADLRIFLQVCREVGLEPLVCILPVHGAWYDRAGVSAQERADFYQRVRDICDEYGAAYADFSSCEYEKYFLCDTTHPGWRGWVKIERAFYRWVNGRDDEFVGGGDYGDVAAGVADGSEAPAGGDG